MVFHVEKTHENPLKTPLKFLRLRRLRSDDSDFFHKSESMCKFFEKRGYPVSVVQADHHRAQLIDRQSSLLLQNDPETSTIFSQPPLISFKRDKNIGNFLVRSSFQTNDQLVLSFTTPTKYRNLSDH